MEDNGMAKGLVIGLLAGARIRPGRGYALCPQIRG